MLPSFIIGGAPRCGTTSMWTVFRQHPEIFMSAVKEPSFFCRDALYTRGLGWYERHFQDCNGHKAVGEASPDYIAHALAPERIARAVPDVKLLFSLRNPVDQAYSYYWLKRRWLLDSRPFDEAIAQPGNVYVHIGHYYQHLQRYLQYFPQENILTLLYDDLGQDPHGFYRRCFQFLGVDDSFVCPEMDGKFGPFVASRFNRELSFAAPLNRAYLMFLERPRLIARLPSTRRGSVINRTVGRVARKILYSGSNVKFKYPPMDPEVRARLVREFQGPNWQLSNLLGRDLSHWNQ